MWSRVYQEKSFSEEFCKSSRSKVFHLQSLLDTEEGVTAEYPAT